MVIALPKVVNILPRFASLAPFFLFMVDHLLCPDISFSLITYFQSKSKELFGLYHFRVPWKHLGNWSSFVYNRKEDDQRSNALRKAG